METFVPLDSALFVFCVGQSVSLATGSKSEEEYRHKLKDILCEVFSHLCFSEEKLKNCIDSLIELAPHTTQGIINQIFIPKANASSHLYLSFGGGIRHPVYDENFEESCSEFQRDRERESFRTFRNFQARLLVGFLFADPQIKIFRYTLIPEKTQKEYETLVAETLDELFNAEASPPAITRSREISTTGIRSQSK